MRRPLVALRDILRREATSVATGGIAEVDGQPAIAEDDARDPNRTFSPSPGVFVCPFERSAHSLTNQYGQDLLAGQYGNPVRIIGFNPAEGWSQDVSEDIARELRRRCDLQLSDVPSSIQDFVERLEGNDRRQLTFRLVEPGFFSVLNLSGQT